MLNTTSLWMNTVGVVPTNVYTEVKWKVSSDTNNQSSKVHADMRQNPSSSSSDQKQIKIFVMQDLPPVYCSTSDVSPPPYSLHEGTSLHEVAQVLVLALEPSLHHIPSRAVIGQASHHTEREHQRTVEI